MCATVCDDTKCSKGQLLLFHNGYVSESAMTQNAARDSYCYSTTVVCQNLWRHKSQQGKATAIYLRVFVPELVITQNTETKKQRNDRKQSVPSDAFRRNCTTAPPPPPPPEKCHRQSGCTTSRIVPQICDIVLWVSVTNTSVHAIVVRISLALFHPVIARNYEEITHRRAINTHLRDRHTETWL